MKLQSPQQFAILILAGALSACAIKETVNIPTQKIDLPYGHDYRGVLWHPDGRLLIFIHDPEAAPSAVKYLLVGDNNIHHLSLADDARCTRYTDYVGSIMLPDRRLGLIKVCAGLDPNRSAPLGDESYLMAYDWNTGSLEQIVEGSLPSSSLSGNFTWNPEMTLGVQALTGLVGTIYWISPRGWEPMFVTVSDGKRSWSLDQNFAALTDLDKTDIGIARSPAWSPDGETIAFLATLDAIGVDGPARGDGEYHLYLMDPLELVPNSVLDNIYYPSFIIWSPDSQWIAFNAYAGSQRQKGLWLFSPSRSSLKLVAEGDFGDAEWSPDGKEIVAMLCLDIACLLTEYWRYDVSQIVQ